jgi:tryptophan-rich sensory protein
VNRSSSFRSAFALFCWIALCFGAAASGAIWSPDAWYAQLRKPAWNPPTWVFGPVWTALYAMMGVSAWRVWRRAGFAGAGDALGIFLLQLALNALWTPVFFGWHRPGWAFAVIVAMWIAILATLISFRRHDRLAAALLVPYLAWVSFASALNFALWRAN